MEKNRTNKTSKIIMLIIIVAVITFLLTFIGMYKYFETGSIIGPNKKENTIDFSNYKKIIDQKYLGEIDNNKLEEYAIKGYFAGLQDPYTGYITPEEMEE